MPPNPPEHSTLRILIIDDELNNRRLLERMLKVVSSELTFAATGAEAKQCAQEKPPQLVLIDKQLPDCDGFDLANELFEQIGDPHLRMLSITAEPYDQQTVQKVCPHIQGVISKPFQMQQLREAVRNELTKYIPSS